MKELKRAAGKLLSILSFLLIFGICCKKTDVKRAAINLKLGQDLHFGIQDSFPYSFRRSIERFKNLIVLTAVLEKIIIFVNFKLPHAP